MKKILYQGKDENMKIHSSESGRSMVEMLGVIAIIGVISVGGITSMAYIDAYFRTSASLMDVDKMANDITDMCSWSSSYTDCLNGYGTSDLVDEDILPSTKNRWGGDITVAPTGGTVDSFTITYTKVPKSVCEQMTEELDTVNADGTTHAVIVSSSSCESGEIVFTPHN